MIGSMVRGHGLVTDGRGVPISILLSGYVKSRPTKPEVSVGKRSFPVTRISLFPTAAVVVTSVNNKGEVGATTIAWNGILSSRPPVLGASFLPDSFTRSCIEESREFVVNVPDGRFWREVNYLGSLSGDWAAKMARAPHELAALTLVQSENVRAPQIDQFYLAFECRLLRTVQIGLYDCFLGEVLAMRADEEVYSLRHPKGAIDQQRRLPILCLGDEYWCGDVLLGRSTENKNHPHGAEH